MDPKVSQALAAVKTRLRLGPAAVAMLIADYGSTLTFDQLPVWIRELS